jgi:vacuolar-type H+-ATPase subunit F/Vma7
MMKNIIGSALLAIAFLLAPVTLAQVSPEEAKAKLAERDAQRQAERQQIIQITAGDLADLRQKLAVLEAQVKSLRAQLADKQTPKKISDSIEIGMTRDEVLLFIKRHPKLEVVGMRADAGVHKSSYQTTMTRVGTSKQDTTTARNGETPNRTQSDVDHAETSKSQVETTVAHGKTEIMEIARNESYREQSGTQRDALGGSHPVYENLQRRAGTITVTFVDGIVTAVDAH